MKLNLHMHSVYSDGVLTPAELVEMQVAEGVEAMSLTDHDSVSGVDEAIEAGKKRGIRVLAGIELSSYSSSEIHILGYSFDYKNPVFVERLESIKQLRRERKLLTIELLNKNGVALDVGNLDFCDGNIGRVHIAREMVKQGFSQSVSDAFYFYLGAGKKAYVEGHRLRPLEAVKLIKDFGGVPVLAHPVFIPWDRLELLIEGLIPYGLAGLECFYSSHNETDTKQFLALAKKHRLITTCGTDYHNEGSYISPSYRNDLADAKSLKKLNLI